MSLSNDAEKIPNGAAWAAILAAGIGCAALGGLIDLAEGSKFFSKVMNFYDPVGNLSGKSTFGVAIWLIAWAVLHVKWKNRDIDSTTTIAFISVTLVILGVVASCPLFFGLFSAT